MRRRWLLTLQGADGRIRTEVLGRDDDFAELVDPNDLSVLHPEPFAMYGDEWTIDSVMVTGDLIRITCLAAATRSEDRAPRRRIEKGIAPAWREHQLGS